MLSDFISAYLDLQLHKTMLRRSNIIFVSSFTGVSQRQYRTWFLCRSHVFDKRKNIIIVKYSTIFFKHILFVISVHSQNNSPDVAPFSLVE